MSEQFVRDYIAGATHLIHIALDWSAWGAKLLVEVLGGFRSITQIDLDTLNGDRSVLEYFLTAYDNRVNNRVDSLD